VLLSYSPPSSSSICGSVLMVIVLIGSALLALLDDEDDDEDVIGLAVGRVLRPECRKSENTAWERWDCVIIS
jgi:hypothetical protein